MAGETNITLIGNLTSDPELRWTANQIPVVKITVASTARTYDRQSGEWRDGEAMFLDCTAWRNLAENIAGTLTKGMRVIVSGRLRSRSYETREGARRTVFEVEIDEIGPSLRYATAQVQRNPYNGGGNSGYSSDNGGGYQAPAGSGYQSPVSGGYQAPTGNYQAPAADGWGEPAAEPPY